MPLLLVFVALPIVEIALFVQIGGLIGVWATLAFVIASFMLGIAVIRSQSRQAWREAQRSLEQFRDPSRPLAQGAMLMLAGMLLIAPGFFTSTVGLLLLIPPVRSLLMGLAGRRIKVAATRTGRRGEVHRPPYAGGVIDADYVIEEEPPSRNTRPPVDLPEDVEGDPDEGDDRHRLGSPGGRPRGNSGWTRY